jgi:protein-tyrosine phosphatase
MDRLNSLRFQSFQNIFNIMQDYSDRLKIFEIKNEVDYEFNHLPNSVHVSPSLFNPSISVADVSKLTDATRLRRFCIIIACSSGLNTLAENFRKTFIRQKCREVYILNEIDEFFIRYPFLLINPKKKDYPNEIIPSFLYLGSEKQALDREIVENLKITHILNITKTAINKFQDIKYCKIEVLDTIDENISRYFKKAYDFIEKILHSNQLGFKNTVLVHCALGVSRSATIVIMFIMKTYRMSLEDSLSFVKSQRQKIDPNPGFMKQLEEFQLHGCNFFKTLDEINLR